MEKFPSYKNIEYFYVRGYYKNEHIKRYVELKYLTEEEYEKMTGEPYPSES
ncbi:XkdX family protein [Staphylococcus pseudintermedius]|nr:XkdX family protein [Staphylococcus pseudintermedius]